MHKLGSAVAAATTLALAVTVQAGELDDSGASFRTAAPVDGMHFTPKNATIVASGSITLTSRRSFSCGLGMVLSTGDRRASVTSVSFVGHQCNTIQATGLPWLVSIEEGGFGGFHPLNIHGFAIQFVHGATCGPTEIPAKLNPHGLIKFSKVAFVGTTPCSVDANVSTSPRLGVRANRG
ncbi:MAG: hypothetical protein ABI906_11175 [Pseudomonadota bacterium]